MEPRLRANGNQWRRRLRRCAAPVVLTFALAPTACSKDKTTNEGKTTNPPEVIDNTREPEPNNALDAAAE